VTAFGLALTLVAVYTWPLASDPAHLFPFNPDCRTLTWVLVSVFHNLLTQPGALLHGNAFYPVGLSLTFTEPLLVPALVAGPIHALLLFWALSGWAMFAVALWLTGDRVAALLAAAVFTLSPYRIGMYLEFQMEILFGVPLAVYTLVRFLETFHTRYLAGFVLVFWLQAISVLYYGVILAVVAVQYAALRWTGWRLRPLLLAAAGAVVLALLMAPVARPFLTTQRELGFERTLAEIDERSANVLTYVELRPNRLYPGRPAGFFYETSVFLGGVAVLLAGTGLLWLRPRLRRPGWPERAVTAAVTGSLALAGLALAVAARGSVASPAFSLLGVAGLAGLVVRQGLEGWRRHQAGTTDRSLEARDWAWLLAGLALAAFLLSLGPLVTLGHRRVGPGVYGWLYPYLFFLRGIRAAERIGVLVVFAGALLAGLGITWLRAHLPRRAFGIVVAVLAVLLALEYAEFPLAYGRVTGGPRPVDLAIRQAPPDAVVLEWPTFVPFSDADAMLQSLHHGRRLVNGYSGFVPDFLAQLSSVLTQTDAPFPYADAEAFLRRIYPLDLLVVRRADPVVTPEWRGRWEALRRTPPPYLRYRGRHGEDDLWQVAFSPDQGWSFERLVSFDFLRQHPVLRATVAPLASGPDLESTVAVRLNGRAVLETAVAAPREITLTLAPPYRQAAPNVVTLHYAYRRPPSAIDSRFRVGATGLTSLGDLVAASAGQPYGTAGTVTFNGVNLARNRRGYNLVAVTPDGRAQASEAFDTHGDPEAAGRLVAFVDGLPPGTLVAGAVKDEASLRLTGPAVAALGTLGVTGDLRGRFRESHAFVGAKGARPGAAAEASGPRAVRVTVGAPPAALGLRLEAFALERATRPR
jgi:hypothetical protein